MKQPKEYYFVNYKEGARGSFIGDIICLLLTNDNRSIIDIIHKRGDAGGICRPWMNRNIENQNPSTPDEFLNLSLKDSSPYDFLIYAGFNFSLWDYKLLDQKNWKCINIVYYPEDKKVIELIKLYKSENMGPNNKVTPDSYWEHYLNSNFVIEGISHPINLPGYKLNLFINDYINHSNDSLELEVSEYEKFYNSLPDEYKNKFYRIDFWDIMTNMDKVLRTIGEYTGKDITTNIIKGYRKYTMYQHLPENILEAMYGFSGKKIYI